VRLSNADSSASHPRVVTTATGGFRIFWTQRQGKGATTWQSAPLPSPAVSALSTGSSAR
jgi:hypothetical protein